MTSGWNRATVRENKFITPGLHQLTLEVPPAVAQAFQSPGQYHRVRVGADEAYFAMASAPGSSRFEYLVRSIGDAAEAWTKQAPGATVEVSTPEGPGFPLAASRGKSLLLIGTGTGFAPLWSVLREVRRDRSAFQHVRALYGVGDESHLVWRDELDGLKGEDIIVEPVLEHPHDDWEGRVGRVQTHLDDLPVHDAVAFLCGHPAMISDVRQLLAKRGIPPSSTFLNVPEG